MKQNQKWLSMLFAFVLFITSFISPAYTYAESMNVNDDSIHKEEVDSKQIDVEQEDDLNAIKDDEVQEKLTKENSKEEKEPSKKEVDATETKERAPPVTVDVRVETHEKTLVPTTEIEVESFELMEYINRNNGGKSVYPDSPRAIHAIIKALENVDGLDLKDDNQFELGSGGNYIESINGLGEFSNSSGLDGWMYFIDNSFVPTGVLQRELEGGESIVLYYVADYSDNTFSWFENEQYSIETGQTLKLALTGVNYSTINPVQGASILIDEQDYTVDDEIVLTDENGKVDVVFNEPGTYHVSANRVNDAGYRNIIRPYAEVVVKGEPIRDEVEKEDEDYDETEEVEDNEIKEVESVITALPATSDISLKDVQVVEEARQLYDALSVKQQKSVDNYHLLVKIEEKLLELKNEIKSVESAIDSLPDVTDLALDDSEEVTAARQLFEDLTDEQQELVSNLDKLKSIEDKLIELENDNKKEYDIEKHIDKTANYILSKGVQSEWEAIGLARAGKEVPHSYHEVFYNHVESQVDDALGFGRAKITDIERLAIAAVAIGKDPQNIQGTNLIKHIYDSPMRGATDSMTLQGNNGPIFALIALNSNDYPEPFDSKWNREKLIDELLNNQNEDGSWALNPNFASPSVDITAMAIIGLAPYKDQAKVKTAIEGAIDYLSSVQNDEGGFTEAFVGGTSSEATAQAIIGLTAYGMDPTHKKFTKNGSNLIDHLLTFHNEDGGFAHTSNYPSSNAMATEQALQGLVAYDLFLKDEGRLYEFHHFIDANNKLVKKVEKMIDSLPTVDDFTLSEKDQVKVTLKSYEKLTDFQKSLVNNYNKLENLETKQKELEKKHDKVKKELESKIKKAKSMNTNDKTEATIANLKESITNAESILNNKKATIADLEKAISDVNQAMEQLKDKPVEEVEQIDKSILKQTIQTAKSVSLADRTESTTKALKKEIEKGKSLLANKEATQSDVDKAVASIKKAIDELEYVQEIEIVEPEKETKVTASKTIRVKGKEDSASIKLPENLPENTSAIVKVLEENEVEEQDRTVAGTVIDVEMFVPNNEQKFEYVLTLDVKKEFVNEKVAIYHFNENNQIWEYVGGEINEDGTISHTVTHFSKYGVFVVKDNDKIETKPEEDEKEPEIEKDDVEKPKEEKDAEHKNEEDVTENEDVEKKEESQLVNTVKEAQKYHKKDYTKKSFEKLNKALSNAKKVLDNEHSTKEDISDAIKLIEQAMDELVEETSDEISQDQSKEKNITVGISDNNSLEADNVEQHENNLPKTATSYYTYMLIGSLLLISALMMLIIRRKRLI